MSDDLMRELDAWVKEYVGPLSSSAENDLCDIVGRMVSAEREGCAKQLADSAVEAFETAMRWQTKASQRGDDDARRWATEYGIKQAVLIAAANAIRARGQTTPD